MLTRVELDSVWNVPENMPGLTWVGGQKFGGTTKPGRYVVVNRAMRVGPRPHLFKRRYAKTYAVMVDLKCLDDSRVYVQAREANVLTHCEIVSFHGS